jgi:hypothetical protein
VYFIGQIEQTIGLTLHELCLNIEPGSLAQTSPQVLDWNVVGAFQCDKWWPLLHIEVGGVVLSNEHMIIFSQSQVTKIKDTYRNAM